MICERKFKKGTTIGSNLTKEENEKYILVKYNKYYYSFDHVLTDDLDRLELCDLKNSSACKIYEASLRMLVAFAIKTLNSKLDVKFYYNISRGIYCKLLLKNNKFKIKPSFVEKLNEQMLNIIKNGANFERIKISKSDAIEKYQSQGFFDKIQILKYRPEEYVHLYKATYKGYEYYDYLYSFLITDIKRLDKFALTYYDAGFILQFPRSECDGQIPSFDDELKFATTLQSSANWAEKNSLESVFKINRFIKKYGEIGLINISESKINNSMSALGKAIVDCEEPKRLICIAGPSSSGKTSFSNRLNYELMTYGLRPIRISVDDFYLPADMSTDDVDLESLDAFDVELFNKCLISLIQGEKTALPTFDFKTRSRTFRKPIVLTESQPIIIEGIHALNTKLTHLIPEAQKFKVYIAPQPQVCIDNHTPLSMTDLRLLRRIMRDARTRDTDIRDGLKRWPSVRNGEYKYIYPTQENADFIFDTFFFYEPCVLKKQAMQALNQIKEDDSTYQVANRLKSILKYFVQIDTTDVPCNSLMREFIGGSSFKDAR